MLSIYCGSLIGWSPKANINYFKSLEKKHESKRVEFFWMILLCSYPSHPWTMPIYKFREAGALLSFARKGAHDTKFANQAALSKYSNYH